MEDVPYGRILREGWLIILVATLLGATAAYGVARLLPETYAATSTMMLQVASKDSSLFERSQFSLARIKTYPALVDSPEVVGGIRDDLDLSADDYSDRELRRMLSAENTPDTVLLVVRADASTADLATRMANSAARHMSELIESTENLREDAGRYDVTFEQVLPAVEPVSPVSPQVTAIAGMGGVLGLAIGGLIAVYRTTTRRRLATIGDVRRSSGLPLVAMLPRRPAAMPAAAAATVGNLVALGGSQRRAFALVPADDELLDLAAIDAVVQAGADVGRDIAVLDLRARARSGDGEGSLGDALSGRHSPGVAAYRPLRGLTPRLLERVAPAAISMLERDHDLVLVIADPGASGLLAVLDANDAAIVPVVWRAATTTSDLVSLTSRLGVMGIRPLGVIMTHAVGGEIGAVAQSWRNGDGGEFTPRAVVPAAEDIEKLATEVDAAEHAVHDLLPGQGYADDGRSPAEDSAEREAGNGDTAVESSTSARP